MRAPTFGEFLREVRAIPELVRFVRSDAGAGLPAGHGHTVIVFPGFLAPDAATAPLRKRLKALGYRPAGWKQGINFGLKQGLLGRMTRMVRATEARDRRKVSLVGWSLGGLYAREIAKRAPECVRLIVTLGTPSSGDMRANNAWRLYERLNDHKVDNPPIEGDLAELPPVPLTSIYTASDGIVAPECVKIGNGPSWETLEVSGSHIGLAWNAEALAIIADRLAQPEGEWRPYVSEGRRSL